MASVLTLLAVAQLSQPASVPPRPAQAPDDAVRSHVLVVLGTLDLAPRARANADAKRLLRALRGRSDVEARSIDSAHGTPWLQKTEAELLSLARESGPKSMVYFTQVDSRASIVLLQPLAVRAGVAVYPVFAGDLATSGPLGDASAEAAVAAHTGEPGFDPGAGASASFSEASREMGRLAAIAESTGGQLVTGSALAILDRVAPPF